MRFCIPLDSGVSSQSRSDREVRSPGLAVIVSISMRLPASLLSTRLSHNAKDGEELKKTSTDPNVSFVEITGRILGGVIHAVGLLPNVETFSSSRETVTTDCGDDTVELFFSGGVW